MLLAKGYIKQNLLHFGVHSHTVVINAVVLTTLFVHIIVTIKRLTAY